MTRYKTTAEILTSARNLIQNPENWTKGKFHDHREINGEQVTCFCSAGALRAVGLGQPGGVYFNAYDVLEEAILSTGHGDGIVKFNDDPDTRHEDVLAVFDLAIEKAKVDA